MPNYQPSPIYREIHERCLTLSRQPPLTAAIILGDFDGMKRLLSLGVHVTSGDILLCRHPERKRFLAYMLQYSTIDWTQNYHVYYAAKSDISAELLYVLRLHRLNYWLPMMDYTLRYQYGKIVLFIYAILLYIRLVGW